MKLGRNPGIFDRFIAGVVDDVRREKGKPGVPRYSDCHAVWFGFDPDGPPNNNLIRPFLRYKACRPIDGLRLECDRHRVELTCTIMKDGVWSNGMGAHITRASGRCLECES